MLRNIYNGIAFQAGWLACVLGVINGIPMLGPTVVAMLLGVHLLFFAHDPAREARIVLTVALLGSLLDVVQIKLGVFSFAQDVWLYPLWMTSIWMMFATTLSGSMSWLSRRYLMAAVLGAVCGPLSYGAGVRLGAIEFASNPMWSILALGAVWGLAMPGLMHLAAPTSLAAEPAVLRILIRGGGGLSERSLKPPWA